MSIRVFKGSKVKTVLLLFIAMHLSIVLHAQRFVTRQTEEVIVRFKFSNADLSPENQKALQLAAKIQILKSACFLEAIPKIDNISTFTKSLERRGSSLYDFVKFYYPDVEFGIEEIVFKTFQPSTDDKKEWSGKMNAICTCTPSNRTGEHQFKTPIDGVSENKRKQMIFIANLIVAVESIGKELNNPPSRVSKRLLNLDVPGYVGRKYGRNVEFSKNKDPEVVESILESQSKVITYATYEENGLYRFPPLKRFGISYVIGLDQVKNINLEDVSESSLFFSSDLTHNLVLKFMAGDQYYLGFAGNVTIGTTIETNSQRWASDETMIGGGILFGTTDNTFNPSVNINYRTLSVDDGGSFNLLGLGLGVDFLRKNLQFGLSYRFDAIITDIGTISTNSIYSSISDLPQKSVGHFSIGITKYF